MTDVFWALFPLGIATLLPVAGAYSTFEASCTTPNTTTNYVSGPDTRGTLDILWGCLFTIIACTWTIQHLNVPEQRDGRDPGWRGSIKWQLKEAWVSLKWIFYSMIAPELILGKSWWHLNEAWDSFPEIRELASHGAVPWSLTHSLFANMGGFVLKCSTVEHSTFSQRSHIPETPSNHHAPRTIIALDSSSVHSVTLPLQLPVEQDGVALQSINLQISEAQIHNLNNRSLHHESMISKRLVEN
jgi:hypothetical protein